MSGHTPGPWVAICPEARHFHEDTDITQYEILSDKTRGQLREEGHGHYRKDHDKVDNVQVCSQFWRDMSVEEAQANARLIAAAPDLLAALEKVWSEGVIPDGFALLQDQVCDAIARATGVQS